MSLDWNTIHDGISHLKLTDDLGIGGFALSIWNFITGQRRASREPLRVDICKSLDDLTNAVSGLSDDIEKHLCYEPGRKSKQDIYRAERKARDLEEAFAQKLPTQYGAIHRSYTDWWTAVTSDGFPVESAKNKFTRSSDRVAMVTNARTKLIETLQSTRHKCLTGKIKYWKQ